MSVLQRYQINSDEQKATSVWQITANSDNRPGAKNDKHHLGTLVVDWSG
jgi:hypothetical protein